MLFGAPYVALKYSYPSSYSVENAGTIADFNGDGNPDFLVGYATNVNGVNTPLRLFLGDGAGGFVDGTATVLGSSALPGTTTPTMITVGDFNNDGYPDAFISDNGVDFSPWPGHTNILLLSDGHGHLVQSDTAVTGAISDETISTSTADINNDGSLDIFVCNINHQNPTPSYFLVNDGLGGFVRSDTNLPAQYSNSTFDASTLADLNGDKFPDLILAGYETKGGQNPSVFLMNDGHGNFINPQVLPDPPYGNQNSVGQDVSVADLNNDGRADIVVTYTSLSGGRYMQILIQDAQGHFVDETAQRLPQSLDTTLDSQTHTYLVDMNGDGHPDIVAAVHFSAIVYLNDGTGQFTESQTIVPINSTSYMGDVSVGDINGDGLPDLVWDNEDHSGASYAHAHDVIVSLNMYRSGNNTLIGDAGSNTLKGFGGNDILQGRGGNDNLYGGFGTDQLTGGGGADKFIYTSLKDSVPGVARDVITDFKESQNDKIDLSAIDTNKHVVGDQAFVFIGSDTFAHHHGLDPTDSGMVRFADGILQAAINGHTVAGFEIQLIGVDHLTAADLIL